jgi:2-oxo-4-hydroxy-4-carboxy-5-ureidoimidazoline decarboxylase
VTDDGPSGLDGLNGGTDAEARQLLLRCCGSSRWVEGMLAARPYASSGALFERAQAVWSSCGREDFLEAFAHHPEIGADLGELRRRFASTATLSESEQSGVSGASEATLLELRQLNQAYRERFGYSFIVCASGKSAPEMLAILQQRLPHAPEAELLVAAAEQSKITRLRLEKLARP